MNSLKNCIVSFCAVVALGACNADDEDPTCATAVPHYYDTGCYFSQNGNPVDESVIRDGCEQGEATAETDDTCASKMKIVLSCMENVPSDPEAADCQVCVPTLVEALESC